VEVEHAQSSLAEQWWPDQGGAEDRNDVGSQPLHGVEHSPVVDVLGALQEFGSIEPDLGLAEEEPRFGVTRVAPAIAQPAADLACRHPRPRREATLAGVIRRPTSCTIATTSSDRHSRLAT